jgi:hypothetical protein
MAGLVPSILIAVLIGGCAPRVASDQEEAQEESAPASAPAAQAPAQEPAPQEPVSADSAPAGDMGMPANPMQMQKMTEEEMERTLRELPPEEHTHVLIRFNSMVLLLFHSIYHRFPTADEGLEIFLAPPPAPDGKDRESLAKPVHLQDAWDRPFSYELIELEEGVPYFKVKSYGPDGVPSGDDIEVEPEFEEECIEAYRRILAGELDRMESEQAPAQP